MSESGLTRRPLAGASAIAMAVGFNVPYAFLADSFDYPDILRRPAGEVLTAFYAGGGELILTWYSFGVAALLLAPLALALSLTPARIAARPALAIGAAVVGALAGVMQAIGLFRWVFVVPTLANTYVDPMADPAERAAATHTFDVLNAYGGIAIGEHLGQLLTALFITLLVSLQAQERKPVTATLGAVTAACIAVGTGEGLAIALGRSGEMFSLFTITGFVGLALWLIATGIALLRGR